MKKIDKLAWLYIHEGKLLNARSKGKTLFYLPGGKREQGELIREIKEEVSVELIADSIKYAGTFEAQADGKDDGVIVELACYFADYQGELSPDAEIAEIAFIGYDDKSLCSLGAIKVMQWLKEQGLV